jgi:hypothetical protein
MKSAIFTTNLENILEYVSRESSDDPEADASIIRNPTFSWAKFILTDDLANENKQRIPKEEFSNLIKTGVNAPVKMELGDPLGDHARSTPLGVVTHLKEIENRIEGIAALWTREREQDVKSLKDMYSQGKLPQLSWEVMYEDSNTNDDGVEDLAGTILRAVTIVGVPAYAGRTPIVALASKKDDNPNTEELTVDELEKAQSKITELESSLSSKEDELKTLSTETEQLREYKDVAEKEKAAAAKLIAIKQKFTEAGLEKDETYFTEKKETLLGMTDDALDFMIQELVAFSSAKSKEESASSKKDLPRVDAPGGDDEDIKTLAEALRQRHVKK